MHTTRNGTLRTGTIAVTVIAPERQLQPAAPIGERVGEHRPHIGERQAHVVVVRDERSAMPSSTLSTSVTCQSSVGTTLQNDSTTPVSKPIQSSIGCSSVTNARARSRRVDELGEASRGRDGRGVHVVVGHDAGRAEPWRRGRHRRHRRAPGRASPTTCRRRWCSAPTSLRCAGAEAPRRVQRADPAVDALEVVARRGRTPAGPARASRGRARRARCSGRRRPGPSA